MSFGHCGMVKNFRSSRLFDEVPLLFAIRTICTPSVNFLNLPLKFALSKICSKCSKTMEGYWVSQELYVS